LWQNSFSKLRRMVGGFGATWAVRAGMFLKQRTWPSVLPRPAREEGEGIVIYSETTKGKWAGASRQGRRKPLSRPPSS
jgi:hypothetical protein